MRKTKVVLATFGTHGDLNPFIAMALRLQQRGLEPVIATSPDYRDKVSAAGIAFHEVRPSFARIRSDLQLSDEGLARRAMANPEFIFRKLTFPYLRVAYEDMMGALDGAGLVLTSSLAFSARLAAEKRAIPHMGVVLQPMLLLSAYDVPLHPNAPRYSAFMRSLGPRVSRFTVRLLKSMTARWAAPVVAFRKELGLPPDRRNPIFDGQYSQQGTLGLYSPLLGSVQPDHPPSTQITGFAFYDDDPEEGAATRSRLATFLASGSSPLVFVLGSSAHKAAGDFFDVSVQAAAALKRRAVLVTGTDTQVASLRGSQDVFVCRYVAYSQLFSAAAVVVHQGGIGTVAQALRAGRPQITVPFHGDQLDNGDRVARLGVGRVILRGRYRRQHVIAQLESMLNEPRYSTAAASIAEQIRREDGAGAAADAVMRALRATA